jgi:streptogramin lyase
MPALCWPIVKATPAGAQVAGQVSSFGRGISNPEGIASGPDGALWFTSGGNHSIGRITTGGNVTLYRAKGFAQPNRITAGPDGALWFTDCGTITFDCLVSPASSSITIGRMTTAGVFTRYSTGLTGSGLGGITAGPDGALWFIAGSAIGRITTGGTVTSYTDPAITYPEGITAGPDGAVWFTNGNAIGRITTGGAITSYPVPGTFSAPTAITTGPDGALWFTNPNDNAIGRITTGGAITRHPASTGPAIGDVITTGPDGAVWFTYRTGNVGRITTGGTVTTYTANEGSLINGGGGMTAGPDGALWFTENRGSAIGRIATDGTVIDYTADLFAPTGIVAGSDGALWFTNYGFNYPPGNSIGRITTAGTITNYTLLGIRYPQSIAAGSDGALWFTDAGGLGHDIGRLSTNGAVGFYGVPPSAPDEIVSGPDGALWFSSDDGLIGRITTSGTATVVAGVTSACCNFHHVGITAGPDGALWVTNTDFNEIDRVTTDGKVTAFTGPGISLPEEITAGPDGALWFTSDTGTIARITTAGAVTTYPRAGGGGITTGPDGALWFGRNHSIGRITTTGVVTSYYTPGIIAPTVIAPGPDGALWLTDSYTQVIARISTADSVTLSPTQGPAGTPLTITGSGFTTGETVTVNYRTYVATVPLCSTVAATHGTFTCTATIPAHAGVPGTHAITATGKTSGKAAAALFMHTI